VEDYKNEYGNLSDDLDKTITGAFEGLEDMKVRLIEKASELNDYNILRDEYENCIDNISKMTQLFETKTRQSRGTDSKLNLDLLKVTKNFNFWKI
jgi:hypothetical protein